MQTPAAASQLKSVAAQFEIPGSFLDAVPHGNGHINDTYASSFSLGPSLIRYIHQRINHRVFEDPVGLMHNILRVTEHQAQHGPSLKVVPARDGRPYFQDSQGYFWRSYAFIENASTYDVIENPAQAEAAARSFGGFQSALASLPGARLLETIPDFHNTPLRLQAFEAALALDSQGRAAGCADALALAKQLSPFAGALTKLQAQGLLPERVTHNDTKLNNVMLDDSTGQGACVIDLDTVMPGLAPCDFGDMVRSATNAAKEDEPDLAKVQLLWPVFEALAKGYLSTAGSFLNKAERACLGVAGLVMTYECGLRFLTDHLGGDTYFKIHRPGQNLDRARNQFKLAQEMEAGLPKMQKLISLF